MARTPGLYDEKKNLYFITIIFQGKLCHVRKFPLLQGIHESTWATGEKERQSALKPNLNFKLTWLVH